VDEADDGHGRSSWRGDAASHGRITQDMRFGLYVGVRRRQHLHCTGHRMSLLDRAKRHPGFTTMTRQ
jgi:hypothetical protein